MICQVHTSVCAPHCSAVRRLMYRYVAILAAIASLGGCANLVSTGSIRAAEAKWLDSGVQDYSFTLLVASQIRSTACSTGPEVAVEVRGGRTVRFGNCSPESEMAQRFGSIPQMFTTIRSTRRNRPPRLLVRFENSLGYPESIDANYSRWMTDHAVQYYVRDFRRLQ
jgi:Family of unknown function (DUF6174)